MVAVACSHALQLRCTAELNCCSTHTIRPGQFAWNRPVHRSLKKPAGSNDFYWFNYINGLLSEPDRFRLRFGLLAVRPLDRSGLNNYNTNMALDVRAAMD
jgi:hypothetical protein